MKKILLFLFSAFLAVAASTPYYWVQIGTPVAIPNFIQPEAGCDWLGVGGQVFDRTGLPVSGLVVRVTGTLEGNAISRFALTGGSTQLGPGGFEIPLTNHPVDSYGAIQLQLFDLAGAARSNSFALNPYQSCEQNLILVNLIEAPVNNHWYFPIIFFNRRSQ